MKGGIFKFETNYLVQVHLTINASKCLSNIDINYYLIEENARMIKIEISQNKSKLIFIVAMATILLLIVGFTSVNIAGAKVKTCDGAFLVDLGQSEALWTLSKEGIFHGTDSAELFLGFSHAQGAWRQTGLRTAKATWLDFNFDPYASAPAGYARIDADLVFGSNCETFSGTLDLRLYGSSDDPLDPSGGSLALDDLSFSGRRINP
jgi:hypothetical protein